MASASISGWRNIRGEPQVRQRPAPSDTSRRQSRQKPGISSRPHFGHAALGRVRSRRIALPAMPAENCARSDDLFWIDSGLRGKVKKQRLIVADMIEHAREKLRLSRRLSDGFGSNSRHFQKASEPPGLRGNEAKDRHREVLRCCLRL